jgi:carbonic anhydrase/acetyltransferase-like protein (isoleucine patch superfamily)
VEKDGVFIASNTVVLGRVRLGPGSSVWFGSVVRGDVATVTIGSDVNVQDLCVIHPETGHDLTIGDSVSLGHGAIVHGLKVGHRTIIGMGARVLAYSEVGDECIVAAGAVVPEHAVVPSRSLVVGVPGKVVRQVTDEEVARAIELAERYRELAAKHVRQGWQG